MLIICMSGIFSYAITYVKAPAVLSEFILGITTNVYLLQLIIMLFLFVLGMFMDSDVNTLLLTPIFLPMVTSITAVGLAWKLMYNKNFCIINYLLSFIGVDKIPWLENAAWSIPALVIFGVWNILPFTIILLLSGLQNIDPQYYTAARVDGSKGLRIFLRITVPLLAPTIFLVCIVNTISCFKVFSELYPLFNGKPGPFNNLYTVVYYIRYAMMESRKYGIAAAAALILFLFIFAFTMVQLLLQKKAKKR